MREIKFRAWTESDKSMTRPLDIGIPDEAEAIRYYGIGQKSGLSILEQFTGLRDKNGREIYEGDILEMQEGKNKYRASVVYSNELARFGTIGYVFEITESTVIGNIHENPERLK